MLAGMTYPGGKGTTYQHIINQMPPHDMYIETYLGGGTVMRCKRPAAVNIGIERDPNAIRQINLPYAYLINGDAINLLSALKLTPQTFIYCDPPYVRSTRQSTRPLYRYEYTDNDHERLLSVLTSLDCMVAISGYWSELYSNMLSDWRYITFPSTTRSGAVAREYLWLNYPPPQQLHDYSFLGADFTERQRIKRKVSRWLNKLHEMEPLERNAILNAINHNFAEA